MRALLCLYLLLALASGDECTARTDGVPCLHIRRCGLPVDAARFGRFLVSDAAGEVPASQPTNGTVCFDDAGIAVRFAATDAHIFSPWTRCDATTWVASDTVEVFLAPVYAATDNPAWYFELDTVPAGAMYAGLVNNSLGNSSTCIDEHACSATGPLPCTGAAGFAHNMTARVGNETGGWWAEYFIPWAIFAPAFRPTAAGAPWPLWRANFYRYDYPYGPTGNFELSAWSPTHGPSFHVPSHFGVIVFDAPPPI